MVVDKHNQGWAEYTNNLEKQSKRRLELLRRLIDHEGMIVFAAPNCSCEDCELVLEIKKELADD